MADSDDKNKDLEADPSAPDVGTEDSRAISRASGDEAVDGGASEVVGQEGASEDPEAGHIGVQRYVHASFFAAGILAAYLSGKLLLSAWNALAEWPEAVRTLPQLIEYSEEERASMTLVIGAVVGVLLILRYYRRPAVRGWATDVASELSRVTWPTKDTVTNGTIVVLVAGAAATLYIALLDRLWGYLTNLIYGV